MSTKSASNFDWQNIGRFALAGGTVGAGAALLRALSRHLASLQETRRPKAYLPLTIPAPEEPGIKKSAADMWDKTLGGHGVGPPTLWAYLLGVPAAYLTGVGAYKGISHAYDKFQERELATELTDAQKQYLLALQQERKQLTEKRANMFSDENRPGSFADWAMFMLAGSIPLAGYASHVLTKRYLDKAFPASKAPEPETLPVRLDVEDRMNKMASGQDIRAWHLTGRTVMAHTKGASILDAFVNAVASGHLEELEDTACDESFEKAAAVADKMPDGKHPVAAQSIALQVLLKSASLREPIKTIIAAELHDMAPTEKVAHILGSPVEAKLLDIGGILGSIGMLSDLLTVKEAREQIMADPQAIKLEGSGTDETNISAQLQTALEQFGTHTDADQQYLGTDDNALVSLLTSGQAATDSRGDKTDVAGASMPSRDEIDEFFEALPQAGRDKRPQPIRTQTSGGADQHNQNESDQSADYRNAA